MNYEKSEDERIRDEICIYIGAKQDISLDMHNRWIAWLEKQGEKKSSDEVLKIRQEVYQSGYNDGYKHGIEDAEKGEKKPADKVEPKFKVGDYLVTDYCKGKVIALTDYAYLLDTEQRIPFSCEHNAHLWTIQDAKNGDVLQLGEVTAIFKEFIGNNNCKCYCSAYNGEFEIPSQNGYDNSYGCFNAIPASKEQRDLLFQKMKEAGFNWDDKKKILTRFIRTIKPNDDNATSIWSDVDEYTLNETIRHLEELIIIDKTKHCGVDVQYYQRDIDWLKTIKERISSM